MVGLAGTAQFSKGRAVPVLVRGSSRWRYAGANRQDKITKPELLRPCAFFPRTKAR